MNISFYLPTNDLKVVEHHSDLSLPQSWHSPSLVWIWATYRHLQSTGLSCTLTDVFPQEGIVVSAGCTVPLSMKTPRGVCHICAAADSPPRFYPQIQIFQNKLQLQEYHRSFTIPYWKYIPHWTQPNLIPRDSTRGERFETIGYFGHRDQLATELRDPSIQEEFNKLGLKLLIIDDNFHDYSQVDAVLAVRSFNGDPYLYKPASKLVNAWKAGVPAILGAESAYALLRQSELDYLEVKTLEDCFQSLKTLARNPILRFEMVANGQTRSREFSDAAITQEWFNLLTKEAPEIYQLWLQKGSLFRQAFHSDQYIRRMLRSLRKRL